MQSELGAALSDSPSSHAKTIRDAFFYACKKSNTADDNNLCLICDYQRRPSEFVHIKTDDWSHLLFLLSSSCQAQIRCDFMKALTRLLRHAPPNEIDLTKGHVGTACLQSLRSSSRPLRILAGQALEVFCDVNACGPRLSNQNLNIIIEILGKWFWHADTPMPVRTTTIEHLARHLKSRLDSLVLRFLVHAMAIGSDLLNGTIIAHLSRVAKHHKKTPYQLISPIWNSVAERLITNNLINQSYLRCLCDFLGMPPAMIVQRTLEWTLPEAIISPRQGAESILLSIATTLNAHIPEICVENIHHILAVVLLLDRDNAQTAVVTLLDVISQGGVKVQLGQLIKSCSLLLVNKLISSLSDSSKKEHVLAALELVAANVQRTEKPDVSLFLRQNVLGIMTHINDIVNDLGGKYDTTQKIAIMTAVKEFIPLVGESIVTVLPQILATLQTAHEQEQLRAACIDAWCKLLVTIPLAEAAPLLGFSVVVMIRVWDTLSEKETHTICNLLRYFVIEQGHKQSTLRDALGDICILPRVADLEDVRTALKETIDGNFVNIRLPRLLKLLSKDIPALRISVLEEINRGIQEAQVELSTHILGEQVNQELTILVNTLLELMRGGNQMVTDLCCQCVGSLGAIDPNRLEQKFASRPRNFPEFSNKEGSRSFSTSLIIDHVLVTFQSSKDTKVQDSLAYAIQELLKYCGFTEHAIQTDKIIAQKWNSLPRWAVDIISPLLDSRYKVKTSPYHPVEKPIFDTRGTYKEWLQTWVLDLVEFSKPDHVKEVFVACRTVVKTTDTSIAEYILPHLVLNTLLNGDEKDHVDLSVEILSVIQRTVTQLTEKNYHALQIVFNVLDFLGHFLQYKRQEAHARRAARAKQANRHLRAEDDVETESEHGLAQVEKLLQSIPQQTMAEASFRTKAYARALLHQEQHMRSIPKKSMQREYAKLQEIYANLDEPDGMAGIAIEFVLPSLEQEVLQHQSIGNWATAHSCFEMFLQKEPTNLAYHIGLLNCMQYLGHYDSMLTQIDGILAAHPDWSSKLAPIGLEASWLAGDWNRLTYQLRQAPEETYEYSLANALLRLQDGDVIGVKSSLKRAEQAIAQRVSLTSSSYQAAYDHIVKLHLISEIRFLVDGGDTDVLDKRLLITLPAFKVREPILNIRRMVLSSLGQQEKVDALWLESAKLARKSGLQQTAYSVILHAPLNDPKTRVERAKLLWSNGESQKALNELRKIIQLDEVENPKKTDAVEIGHYDKALQGNIRLLYAKYLDAMNQSQANALTVLFKKTIELIPDDEKAYYRLGFHYDTIYKASRNERKARKSNVSPHVIKNYLSALMRGTKFFFQAMPRMLTVWLDLGATCWSMQNDTRRAKSDFEDDLQGIVTATHSVNNLLQRNYQRIPMYQWLAVFSQLLSRLNHSHEGVYEVLEAIVTSIIQLYPHEALWSVMSSCRSTSKSRQSRCYSILSNIKATARSSSKETVVLIDQIQRLTDLLIQLCDHKPQDRQTILTMSRDFRALSKLGPLKVIVPQQSALSVRLPANVESMSGHKPFQDNPITVRGFTDDIEILPSLQKPKKIGIIGNDAKTYVFLCKPDDDLRKDSRLMEFNGVINKILKKAPGARARNLYIRTYSVVPLNEECGIIEWVADTVGLRHILIKLYKSKKMDTMPAGQVKNVLESAPNASTAFMEKVLPMYPPVLHEWLVETFPDPPVWFRSRLAYSRTTAVMSMIGHIVGLGDRHGENILLDQSSGDCVHVDFNCLFEKGLTFNVPERVPFRLTQNMVDAFGVLGYEACETTLSITRQNQDSLMSVLEAFLHDPVVEWNSSDRRSLVEGTISRKAQRAFDTIKAKLQGYHSAAMTTGIPLSIEGCVQDLIMEATDAGNLSKMYIGWTAWF